MSIKNIISSLFLVFSLSGCSFLYDTFVYQIDVTQGNYIEDEELDKVEVGMTQEQIIFILGSPMLIDQFDSSKWYYIRFIKPGGKKIQQQQVVFTFNNQRLSTIERRGLIDDNPLRDPKFRNSPNIAAESTSDDNTSTPDNIVTIDQ